MENYCSNCGAILAPGALFCLKCGERTDDSSGTAPESAGVHRFPMGADPEREALDSREIWQITTPLPDPDTAGRPVGNIDRQPVKPFETPTSQSAQSVPGTASSQVERPGVPAPAAAQQQVNVVCPKCGASQTAGSKFCYRCGTRFTDKEEQPQEPPQKTSTKLCNRCGALLHQEAKFCVHCGAHFDTAPTGQTRANIPPVNTQQKRRCTKCGAEVPDENRFCLRCGAVMPPVQSASPAPVQQPAAPARKRCPKCGKPLAPTASFCLYCGAKADSAPSAAPQSAPQRSAAPQQPAAPKPAPQQPAAPKPVPQQPAARQPAAVPVQQKPLRPCPQCGAMIREDLRFCIQCGARFDTPAAPAASADGKKAKENTSLSEQVEGEMEYIFKMLADLKESRVVYRRHGGIELLARDGRAELFDYVEHEQLHPALPLREKCHAGLLGWFV